MESIIIGIVLIFVALLILVMFLFLKKTIAKINQQSKDFFVDKLQAYDDLINEREEKLKGLKKDIEQKQKKLMEQDDISDGKNRIFLYDLKNIDYQDDQIFKKMKEIDQRFNIDTVKLVKKFLKENFKKEDVTIYDNYKRYRKEFNQKMVFSLISLRPSEQEKEVKRIMGDLAYIVDDFKKKNKSFETKKFLSYFDKIIDKVDPYVYIYVGSKDENYDALDPFIRTKYDNGIYRGISIIYKGKLYDYSLK